MPRRVLKSDKKAVYPRVGFGLDVHRLVTGRKLVLGGVEIPHPMGLEGHSDADVLLHAVGDALLGAAALGDIGKHFPDTDPRYSGISSLLLLHHIRDLLGQHRYHIINIDITLVLESPKISPYIDAMCDNISEALNVARNSISIKATTNEGLGFIGTRQGATAHAVATIIQQ